MGATHSEDTPEPLAHKVGQLRNWSQISSSGLAAKKIGQVNERIKLPTLKVGTMRGRRFESSPVRIRHDGGENLRVESEARLWQTGSSLSS